METKTSKTKPLSGVRKWWREQLDAPHPQSMTNSVPICPCVYCYHGGDPHPPPHGMPARNTFSSTFSSSSTRSHHTSSSRNHDNKKLPLYHVPQASTTSISSYGSLAPLIQERDSERTNQARTPNGPTGLVNRALLIPNGQIPNQMPRPLERMEQHGPGDQKLADDLHRDR